MAGKHSISAVFLLAATAVAGLPAAADEAGCAALAERVKAAVTAGAREQGLRVADAATGRTGRMASTIGGPYTCSATAAVVSQAFGDALRELELTLAWSDDWLRPGDYCLSHRLDQCDPRQDRFSPLPPPAQFGFVARAWRSVSRALASQMPYGPDGDLSSFTDASLDAALATELRLAANEPLRRQALRDPAGWRSRVAGRR